MPFRPADGANFNAHAMKTFILTLATALLSPLALLAQQAPIDERTPIPYEYPSFRDATVTMMFGSKKQVKGNIYLDGSKFYFMQDGKAIEADPFNIHRVQFGDSLYIPIQEAMGLIVAEDSGKMLVCVKTIDTYKMKGRKDGFGGRNQSGEGLPFFQLDVNGVLGTIDLDNSEAMEKAGKFPLKREYYFLLDGDIVPAKERPLLSRYDKARRKELRVTTENRFWSWKDEKSLIKLLYAL